MARVAEFMVDSLRSVGVRRIYGVVGDSLNGLTEALRQRKEIEWIGVRHEEVAAFAAGAEAHLTGSLAVCAKVNVRAQAHARRINMLLFGRAQVRGWLAERGMSPTLHREAWERLAAAGSGRTYRP